MSHLFLFLQESVGLLVMDSGLLELWGDLNCLILLRKLCLGSLLVGCFCFCSFFFLLRKMGFFLQGFDSVRGSYTVWGIISDWVFDFSFSVFLYLMLALLGNEFPEPN